MNDLLLIQSNFEKLGENVSKQEKFCSLTSQNLKEEI